MPALDRPRTNKSDGHPIETEIPLDVPSEGDGVLSSCRDPDADQHLENLRAALKILSPELSARLLRTPGRPPFLRVTNTAVESFAENIAVRPGAASCDPAHYLWSWNQPIGSVADPESAAAAVSRVLAARGHM